MQKLSEDKGLVSKCKYRSRLVLIELAVGIRFCDAIVFMGRYSQGYSIQDNFF